MRRVDLIAALGLIAFAGIMAGIVIPMETSEGTWHGLSPYFYPMVMVSGVALASAGLLVQSLLRPDLYTDQPNPLSLQQLGFFLLICLIILAGVMLIHWFGFLIGGPLLIAGAMLFMGERNPLRIAPTALLTVAGVWALVTWGLKTPLP
jgi:hypothetical protein